MKKKQGFTLVEIIITICIVGLVFGIGAYYATNFINNSKQEVAYINETNIKTSAKLYLEENEKEVIWNENQVYIPITELVNKGYIEKDKVTDHYNKCVLIIKDSDNETFLKEEIVDCDNASKVITKIPTASENCKDKNYNKETELPPTYNGTSQVLTITSSDGYTFSSNTQTNAGNYKVKASLKENYIWEDGTTEDKTITCKLNKATPNLSLDSEYGDSTVGKKTIKLTSEVAGEISLKSSSTSYVTAKVTDKSINANTEKEITINVLATRDEATTITITLTPTDNTNYKKTSITYTAGKITQTEIAIPTCNEGLEYRGTEIILVSENTAYTLSNNIQNQAGTYNITAKLKYGYLWEDGTTEDKTITCTVSNKTNTITLDNQGATNVSGPTTITAIYNEVVPSVTITPEKKYTVTYIEELTNTNQTVTYQYEFEGYYTSPNGAGTQYINEKGEGVKVWDKDEDITLYAYWKQTNLSEPSITIPTGYDPVYWTTTNDADGDKITPSSYHPTTDITLYGHVLDTTPPQCTVNLSGTKKINYSYWYPDGVPMDKIWHTSNVTIKYVCTDTGSGCTTNSANYFTTGDTVSNEGTTTYSSITVSDNSGNTASCPDQIINIDKTAPTITIKSTGTIPEEEQNKTGGRYTGLAITYTDNTSGLLRISRSHCAPGSSDYNYCSYVADSVTYSNSNRLMNYLKGTSLANEKKAYTDYCKMTTEVKKTYTMNYYTSYHNIEFMALAQDKAGNVAAKSATQTDTNTPTVTDKSSSVQNWTIVNCGE